MIDRCHFTQECRNLQGSYRCICPPGFRSDGPGFPCTGQTQPSATLSTRSSQSLPAARRVALYLVHRILIVFNTQTNKQASVLSARVRRTASVCALCVGRAERRLHRCISMLRHASGSLRCYVFHKLCSEVTAEIKCEVHFGRKPH